MLDNLSRIQKELPEELRAARWMVREREAYIARTNETARGVFAEAKKRSDELVSESYIVQEAVEEANALVRNAEGEARRIRLESEDFAERHLAEAEQVLGELLRYVREARAELHQALPPAPEPPISE
jgi:vacuolar-type H+-ATPase subunit H